ncbi:MAG TPA: ATP-binding cassette domain-containing protein [Elusimicrobiota bacterium]|nr:ATP-binding cassette domain-containing protein [Elusimicrobiota bacterium]
MTENSGATANGNGVAIRAEKLGKQYKIQTYQDKTVFRQILSFMGQGPARKPLWALKGIDLEVKHGECLGLIGPNGAGKSTLLQVLGGFLTPTEGMVERRGRITPFLGLGAAAYSDLPVLDNLRLIGSLLGLTSREMAKRLDDIVKFAEIEDYLYARLSELSSGYQGRVIFSAALYSPIDILLIDEIFAAGDSAFQKKCIKVMDSLRQKGTTVILASHGLDFVKSYCTRVVYLERGEVQKDGDPEAVIGEYLERHGLSSDD